MYKNPREKSYYGKYEFVTLASLRAEQLQMGARPRVEGQGRKVTMLAQDEVASGEIGRWTPEVEEIIEQAEEE